MKVHKLKAEYKTNPLGIGAKNPRLSWEIHTGVRNTTQTAYQLQFAFSPENVHSGKNLFWDTQKVDSDQSTHVLYAGPELKFGQKIYWRVKVWDNHGNISVSDENAWWEYGMLPPSEWKASWISTGMNEDISHSTPCSYLRKEFRINKAVKEARAYVSALGLYQLQINGSRVGDQVFTPGWTSYNKRVQYQVFDITGLLTENENAVGAILADGWYRGYLVWQGNKNLYGDKTALIAQLKISYTDGSEEWVITDGSWKSSFGPLLKSDIYNGETYDARLENTGWDKAGFDDQKWKAVKILNQAKDVLVPSVGEPVRITETIKPVKEIITPRGERVFDLGQNIVGWVQFKLRGERGAKITLHHAEVLDKEKNFYTDNLRDAKAEDVYIFKGEGVETYEPHFTFHGFRYIRVSDYAGEISINDIAGRVVHSDMDVIGHFECSDSMLNRLQKNILWGLRGNFLDVPTDCPQRDERLGWTGDAQVFTPTACFNVNAAPFFTKWMQDLSIEQRADGSVPWVVPNVVEDGGGTGWSDGFGATGWADAAVIIPWEVYKAYGDVTILETQYPSMKAWLDYMRDKAGERYIFDYGFHFGDWLSFAEYHSYKYNAPDYGYAGAYTEKDLIATAYFYYSASILLKIAKVLGKPADARAFAELLPKIKSAFRNEFITPSGRLSSGTQTAYVLALSFGLIPEEFKQGAAKRLADDVNHFEHLTTGFLGTPLICQALSENGYPEIAYKLLFNKRYPSWLYPVSMGATTIWERWDGIKPDGTFQTVGMNSFNHYAYGAIGQWLYSHVAGLRIDEAHPGYKHIVIHPVLTDALDHATARLKSGYGEIVSSWQRNESCLRFELTIPANTGASIILPTSDASKIYESGKPISTQKELAIGQTGPDSIQVEVGSGNYVFELIN